ncbi:MAG: carbon-nitrogen hydrolase family protein [Sedimentisphaerales bacterium]|nr:carbon-nitrogen hydrolase family protein [Sedimentisphaerales bacterium]
MKRRAYSRRDFMKVAGVGLPIAMAGATGAAEQPPSEGQAAKRQTVIVDKKQLPRIYRDGFETLKVGLCQVHTQEWALDENLARTLTAIEAAAEQGAEIAVTPECVIHAYPFDDTQGKSQEFREKLFAAAESLDGPRLKSVCQKARELSIHIVIGFVEEGTDDQIHNAAALISPQGEILRVYRKVHCRHFESIDHWGYFTPGDDFFVERLTFGNRTFNVGLMICFDREMPESVRCLRALGAEIILCPLATNTSDMSACTNRADNESITRIRATSNELFIVVVNHADRFNGGSFIVGPLGELFCQLGQAPEVLVYDLPVGIITKKFHNEPLGWMGWGYRRPDIYNKYL